MKKFFVTFLVVNVLLGVLGVSAMSESKLLEKLSAKYDINGTTYQLRADDKVLAERYLNTNEVSSKDADYIASKIDEAIEIMKKSGEKDFTNFSKLPASLKKDLKKLVQDVASNTSVKATTAKGVVIIYNQDGTVFAEITGLVKNTGSNLNIIVPAAILVVALGAVVLVKNVKANA